MLGQFTGFFSFLSSKLLHNYNFNNSIDFYGSFLSVQDKYKNVDDKSREENEKLLKKIEEGDDVQNIYHNMEN